MNSNGGVRNDLTVRNVNVWMDKRCMSNNVPGNGRRKRSSGSNGWTPTNTRSSFSGWRWTASARRASSPPHRRA